MERLSTLNQVIFHLNFYEKYKRHNLTDFAFRINCMFKNYKILL